MLPQERGVRFLRSPLDLNSHSRTSNIMLVFYLSSSLSGLWFKMISLMVCLFL